MKFSYTLLKQLVPEIKNPKDLEKQLTLYAFEVDGIEGKTFDIKLPANRYGDAASHWGMAREIAAIYGAPYRMHRPIASMLGKQLATSGKKMPIAIAIEDAEACPRYIGAHCDSISVGKSPKWLRDALAECGMRSINNVVDVMNYVMLETGQPLHAFDAGKIEGGSLAVRRAKKNEQIVTLDGQPITLDESMIIITDARSPLAIAGIKGGARAEVDGRTKRIIIEAANFDAVSVYRTSRAIGLPTDASARFSRELRPELASLGIQRAIELLKEIAGARPGAVVDLYPKRRSATVLRFDLADCNRFIGTDFDAKTVRTTFERLGFGIRPVHAKTPVASGVFLVDVPVLRTDIEHARDLYEEVVRLHGFNALQSRAPMVRLSASGFEDAVVLKDKIRTILVSLGLYEAYNHSFVPESFPDDDVELRKRLVALENPISKEFWYMRPTLSDGLVGNIAFNARYFDRVPVFEIGRTFSRGKKGIEERSVLGIALAAKEGEQFFVLKGIISNLLRRAGLVDATIVESTAVDPFEHRFVDPYEAAIIVSGGMRIGHLAKLKPIKDAARWHGAIAEIDLDLLTKLVVAEHEYLPLSKYPSIMRDLSLLVDRTIRVGDIMQAIQETDLHLIDDVDLIDEYENEQLDTCRSLTFRVIFQAEDRTLTDDEVNRKIEAIVATLRKRFSAELR